MSEARRGTAYPLLNALIAVSNVFETQEHNAIKSITVGSSTFKAICDEFTNLHQPFKSGDTFLGIRIFEERSNDEKNQS